MNKIKLKEYYLQKIDNISDWIDAHPKLALRLMALIMIFVIVFNITLVIILSKN